MADRPGQSRKTRPYCRSGENAMAIIVVVDDRQSERQYLTSLFEYEGHSVISAGDGFAAMQSISSTSPDLVFTDIVMPMMDGFEFVRQLREHPGTRNTPVVLYTAAY